MNKKIKQQTQTCKVENKVTNKDNPAKSCIEKTLDDKVKENPFSHRKILNNWSKYEKDVEESTGPSDFSTILQASEKVNSKYQYQNLIGEDSSTTELNNYFSLDSNLLDSLLSCIPLHTRLEISQTIFEEEDLKLFKALSEEHKKIVYLKDSINISTNYPENKKHQIDQNCNYKEEENINNVKHDFNTTNNLIGTKIISNSNEDKDTNSVIGKSNNNKEITPTELNTGKGLDIDDLEAELEAFLNI